MRLEIPFVVVIITSEKLMKWSIALSQYLGSKAVVDKINLPQKYYNMVDSSLKELEKWSTTFKGLEIDKPHTYFQTGLNVMRKISVPEEEIEVNPKSLIVRYAEKKDFVRLENCNTFLFYQDIIRQNYEDAIPIIKGDKGIFQVIPMPSGENFHFYELLEKDSEMEYLPFLPDMTKRPARRLAVEKSLATLYWENRQIIKLDLRNDVIEFDDVDAISRNYEGELTSVSENLIKCRNAGIRRSILFQGPPGTGKSTLVGNISSMISKRTVVLTHSFMDWVNEHQWATLLRILQPEMIIVDDIDRISRIMERKLAFFEDHYCNVPFILMTSNHYTLLPDAFKRPGRIDEIIEMQNPVRKIRYEVIRSIAQQEGIAIPEDRMPILDEIHEEYPGAYIVELLRRVKAYGWDYQIPAYDLTFKELKSETRNKWNGPKISLGVATSKDDLDPLSLEIQDMIGDTT